MSPAHIPSVKPRRSSTGVSAWRWASLSGAVVGALVLGACASRQDATGPAAEGGDQGVAARSGLDVGAASGAVKADGQDIATRHALFKVSSFDTLPGWRQDNLGEAWSAFTASCKALERKPNWKALCAQVKTIKDPKQGRALLEREFALLTVQNTDRTREGDITGYYEPLLSGQAQRGGNFVVPVYGVPNDLYVLDWKTVPTKQRKGVTTMAVNGRMLVPAQPGQAGVINVDLRKFTLDTLDRRLRVRLQGNEGLPYYNRADINRQVGLDAPVLAWVDDPLALYAMQVQGAGRIRLPDGSTIRLQYADQNGHPFKPMQLAAAAQGNERVQTRGRADGGAAESDEPEHFELAELAGAAAPLAGGDDEPLTRGTRKPAPVDASVAATVESLTPAPGSKAAPARAPAPLVITPSASLSGGGAKPGSQQMVNDLLNQAQQGARKPGVVSAKAPGTKNQAAAPVANTVAGLSATLLSQRSRALDSDPSYVFFRVAPDQTAGAGPVGALGVPLTAGRSLAVDPRVLPLGYPVFLDAAGGDKRQPQMQRLMFAQDTGGAIRGAVRADYFWGFGADAGRQARRTKHRGRMWVLVPHAEVDALLSSKLVTRGGRPAADQAECLVDDEAFCDAATDESDTLTAR